MFVETENFTRIWKITSTISSVAISVNKQYLSLTIKERSHKKMLKSNWSAIDPCGTPYLMRLITH